MNKRPAGRLLAIAAFVLSSLDVFANGVRLSSQDGFATARGEAFVATADNPSAVYYNPAGIAQLDGTSFRGGIYGIYLEPTFRPPGTAPNAGNTYDTKNHNAAVPQSFIVHSLTNTPLSLGLGIYAPYGLGLTWPQDTGFRAVGIKSSLTYLRFNPVVAVRLPYDLSVGAGVSADYSKIVLEQGLLPFPKPLTNFFKFSGDGWTIGYNFGAMWKPIEQISIGGSFRSSTTITMEGKTEFEQFPFPGFFPKQHRSAHADFTFPLTAVVGISYRPTSKWNIEINADYTDWSSFGTVTVHQKNPPPPLTSDNDFILKWQSSWNYEFGVTRYLEAGWHVSGGYIFSEGSVPNDFYTPLVADMDRHFFSVGVGRQAEHWNFDVAYQFGYGPTHTVTGSTPGSLSGQFSGQTADGKYNFISHAVLVTVGKKF